MWTDFLTKEERDYCLCLLIDLKYCPWVQPLIKKIEKGGGICKETKPLLFELRFAAELYHLGLSADYEHKAGMKNSTVDFRIKDDSSWLIELVSINISDAVKRATKDEGLLSTTLLRSDAEDKRQSVEGEIIKLQEKVGEKVYSNDKPIKFPPISDNVFSLILVDMRGYLDGGGDVFDYDEIAQGKSGLASKNRWVNCWNGKPIEGIFENDNPLRAAKNIQERIHFLGFVEDEKGYGQGTLLDQTHYCPNQLLLDTDESVKAVYNKMPFRKEKVKAI